MVAAEKPPRPPTRRTYQRRRRAMLLVFVALAILVLVAGQLLHNDEDRSSVIPATAALSDPQLPSAGLAAAVAARAIVKEGKAAVAVSPGLATRTGFGFINGYGPVLGSTGHLRRFKVAVERSIGQPDRDDFVDEVDRILGDPRGWTAGRRFRLQRVPQAAGSEFTIYLAAAASSEKMCARGGIKTEGYTSCRMPGQVIINLTRWNDSVPRYRAPLAAYRAYVINHEVGHQLGHEHEACAGRGRPAPVMMQQTYGLVGCTANSWPYINGRRYAGSPTA